VVLWPYPLHLVALQIVALIHGGVNSGEVVARRNISDRLYIFCSYEIRNSGGRTRYLLGAGIREYYAKIYEETIAQ
jgi:hypothetical protein